MGFILMPGMDIMTEDGIFHASIAQAYLDPAHHEATKYIIWMSKVLEARTSAPPTPIIMSDPHLPVDTSVKESKPRIELSLFFFRALL